MQSITTFPSFLLQAGKILIPASSMCQKLHISTHTCMIYLTVKLVWSVTSSVSCHEGLESGMTS